MATPRKTRRNSRKPELVAAALRLAARNGMEAATVRSIARAAGVTDGALYRHFRSKEAMYLNIYRDIIQQMIREKEEIVASQASVRQKLEAWVRVSYEHFDRHAEAFTFVLLTPHELHKSAGSLTSRQGELFLRFVRRAQAAGDLRKIPPRLALAYFTGLMLNIPRLIREGVLAGPATRHARSVADAVWRVLRT